MTEHSPVVRPVPAAVALRFTGAIDALSATDRTALLDRAQSNDDAAAVTEIVRGIIARVRAEGDAALLALALELDGAELATLEVSRERCDAALATLDPDLRCAMERAARNIARFHEAQAPRQVVVQTEPGIVLAQRPEPLERVGIYAPGGRARYASSVLMAAIPARVAGVSEIILCSPPNHTGSPASEVLAAAALAGVDRVFALGGAGAIAALAYGTASVPRVDRIVGPGNAYVAAAKLHVSTRVAIDSPAGPSEIVVIADAGAPPEHVARELLAQAEHDQAACALVIALGRQIAANISRALEVLIFGDPAYVERRAILLAALANHGGILEARSLDQAIAFTNAYAPEHLLLAIAGADAALPRVRHAGTVFVGGTSSVTFGDYMSGANHVLPTGGFARAFSGLSVLGFVRWTTQQRMDAGAAARLANDVALFAEAERLPAHAAAARAHRGGTETGGAAVSRSEVLCDRDFAQGRSPVLRPAVGEIRRQPELRARTTANGEVAASTASQRARASDSSSTSAAPTRGSLAAPSASSPALESRTGDPSPARSAYRAIEVYSGTRPRCAVDLGDNTNAFGPPPSARRLLRGDARALAARYPSAQSEALCEALARYMGVSPDEVVTGCGSDDVLDSALRAFAEPGDRVAYLDPTFSMIPVFARMNGLEPVAVPLTRDFDADPDALLATGARILYLCSPNNPTGTSLRPETIARIVAAAKGLVILDQAYAEFARQPRGGASPRATAGVRGLKVLRAPNLLVVRTLSKAFGLAGLRVGYGVSNPAIATEVAKSRGPFKVSALAERAAVAVLSHDLDWVAASVRAVRRNRRRFTRALQDLGFRPLRSDANFVLVPVRDAATFAESLRAHDVAVRPFPGLTGIGDAVRITIGRRRDMERALAAMAAIAPDVVETKA